MKKALVIILISIFVFSSLSFIIAKGVGNPDTECQTYGFDYGVVKYECGESELDELGLDGVSYNITIEWTQDEENDCNAVSWNSDPVVYGVLTKEGKESFTHLGGYEGIIYKGDHGISHLTFCGMNPPMVPEFGLIIGLLTILSAVGIFFIVRRE